MNFSPGKLDYCYEHSGIQGMFLDDPGFQGVLHVDCSTTFHALATI